MLEEFDVLSQLKINEDRFRGFLLELRSHHIVSHPYHSWSTSVSICQMIFHMVTVGNASSFMSIKDLFCIFIAALSIGIDHCGASPPVLVQSNEEYQALTKSPPVVDASHIVHTIKRLAHNTGSR